ncbi:MAG: DNA repair protein RecO [Deltaproteobacteria bacterium]|nr:DNA repair protein RecO [Deltaproteobacteria bacterium]
MNQFKTDGIIIRSVLYGESDLILTILTPDMGKIPAIAKGAKRSKKRFPGGLNILYHGSMQLAPGKKSDNLYRLDGFDVAGTFSEIQCDYHKVTVASFMLELTEALTVEGDSCRKSYGLLLEALTAVEDCADLSKTLIMFQLRSLDVAGYCPDIASCRLCGRKLEPSRSFVFSLDQGCLYCQGCRSGEGVWLPISTGTLMSLLWIIRNGPQDFSKLKLSAQAVKEARDLLDSMIRRILGRELKTFKFLPDH